MIALAGLALAAPPEPLPEPRVEVALRGVVERWNDPAIASVYKSGTWLGALGLVVPIAGPVGVDAEVGFSRVSAASGGSFEIAPLSLLAEGTAKFGLARGFVGLGPAWTAFTERAGAQVVDGARLSLEARVGVRVDTRLVDPPSPPATGGPVRRVSLEVAFARRSELPSKAPGFALGAWRGTVGLGVAF